MNVLYGWRRSIGGFLEECVPIVCPSRSGGGGQHLNALGVVPGGLSHIKFDVGGLKRVLASGLAREMDDVVETVHLEILLPAFTDTTAPRGH